MKKILLALACLSSFQVALASNGVIMQNIRKRMPAVEVRSGNPADDYNATAHARFGFAMGVFAHHKKVIVQSLNPDGAQNFHFQLRDDDNRWKRCTVAAGELVNGAFEPVCQ